MPDLTQEGLAARGLRDWWMLVAENGSIIGAWREKAHAEVFHPEYRHAELVHVLEERIPAALEDTGEPALIREAEARGMERAAKLVDKRAEEYDREFGIYDYTTGVTEYPGTGNESMEEWESISAAIRAAAAALRKDEEPK